LDAPKDIPAMPTGSKHVLMNGEQTQLQEGAATQQMEGNVRKRGILEDAVLNRRSNRNKAENEINRRPSANFGKSICDRIPESFAD
jgi:hypothetical protein